MAELNELYSPKFEQQLEKLKADFNVLKGDMVDIAKGLKSVDTSLKGVSKSRQDLNTQQQQAEKLRQEAIKSDTLLIKKKQELKKVQLANQKVVAQATRNRMQEVRAQEQLNKAAARTQREIEKQNSSYQKLNRTLGNARKHAKEMATQYGLASKQFLVAQKRVTALDSKIKKIDGALGLHQRNVGNYAGGLKNVAGAMGLAVGGAALVAAGIRKVGQAISATIDLWAGFSAEQSKLQAITGANSEEMKLLTANAERLGASTQKTAKDVLGLSIEFAKLGFTTKEIDAATEATLQLSIAAGSDLATSAVVAASTVRGFGLDAKETQRVVDVMAKSFTSSALDMEKFKTAMAIVAPVAKASGKDIEFTSAQLSILADAGVDASTAGTSLRNMFLELNKKGLEWDEALDMINNSTNKNVTALDLFGKRGATAALILADNTDKAEDLEIAYDNAAGAAQRMSDIMADNLRGDMDKVKSATEALGISLGKRLNNALRASVQLWGNLVSGMNELMKIEPSEEIRKEADELNNLVIAATEANTSQEARNELLEEIQLKYPDFLGNLDAEEATNEDLRDRLKEVNEEYEKKIKLAVQDAIVSEDQARLVQLQADEVELLKEQARIRNQLQDQYERQGLEFTEEIWKQNWAYKDFNRALEFNRDKQAEARGEMEESLKIFDELNAENVKLSEAEQKRIDDQKAADEAARKANEAKLEAKRKEEEAEKQAIADAKEAKKLEKERLERVNKEVKAMSDLLDLRKTEAEFTTNQADAILKMTEATQLEEAILQKRYDNGLISKNKFDADMLRLHEEYRQNLKGINEDIADDTREINEGILEDEEKLLEELDKMFEEDFEKEQKQNEEKEFDKVKFATDAANVIFSVNDSLRHRQLERLEQDHEANLLRIGDDEQAREEAEQEFAIAKAKIDRKQAIADKGKALFDIGINTAVAVVKSLPNPFLVALTIATGLAQTAAVLAKPLPAIPEFDTGTRSAPKGMIAVAEKRPEIVKEKGKQPYLLTRPTITDQLTGAEIIGGAETDRILRHMQNGSDEEIMYAAGLARVEKAIQGIKIEFGYNNHGQAYVRRNEKGRITYANYYDS